jgi:hypothetical protein
MLFVSVSASFARLPPCGANAGYRHYLPLCPTTTHFRIRFIGVPVPPADKTIIRTTLVWLLTWRHGLPFGKADVAAGSYIGKRFAGQEETTSV